jgi:hypothetical protein
MLIKSFIAAALLGACIAFSSLASAQSNSSTRLDICAQDILIPLAKRLIGKGDLSNGFTFKDELSSLAECTRKPNSVLLYPELQMRAAKSGFPPRTDFVDFGEVARIPLIIAVYRQAAASCNSEAVNAIREIAYGKPLSKDYDLTSIGSRPVDILQRQLGLKSDLILNSEQLATQLRDNVRTVQDRSIYEKTNDPAPFCPTIA